MKILTNFINNGPAVLVLPTLVCLYFLSVFVIAPIEEVLRD